ncbi:MAG: NERD domain-containing protein [Betaproteobacteria bacterium]|nr:NERD domain-containing protein [Betaproteobacteria bacterium]
MRMIPREPLHTNSDAEKRVFDQLRAAFSGPDQMAWFSMHSLNLPRHEYKRFGEIDFIVCGPDGLLVLEVKGGGVSCRDGVWVTRNRYGETDRLKESPFKQAEGALHGLRKKLPHLLEPVFVSGYGVVMPDVENLPESAEWDRAVFADAKDFKQFEKWLSRLIKHWSAKDPRKPHATFEQLKQLQQLLRPDFEAVVPMHVTAGAVESRIARLTEDQLRLIDAVEANDRVICSGGAGTGKTMLGLELAKRWTAAGMTVAMTCHSPWLKSFLDRVPLAGLTVCLSDSIHLAARRNGIEKFDAVVVDEGQDILNMESLSKLDAYVKGGLDKGRWCFFHDINNQSGLCGAYVPDAYEYLSIFAPTKIPLRTNCRNSLPILNRIQDALQADMGNSGVGDGPSVRESFANDHQEAIQFIEHELETLTEKEGFMYGDIVILSHLPFAASLASSLSHRWRKSISILDGASPLSSVRQTIGFAQIPDFKGLESEVIVLVDLPTPGSSADLLSLHYVGMSRARVVLSMITVVGS